MLPFLFRLTRWQVWYRSKVPLFLVCIYYAVLAGRPAETLMLQEMMSLLVTLCVFAGFGHIVNFLSDREVDLAAGKPNPLVKFSSARARMVAAASMMTGLGLTLLFYHERADVLVLFFLAYAAAVFYSLAPFRLKEKDLWGLLAAALAQRTVPAVIIFQAMRVWDEAAVALCVLSTLIGLRGILSHQIYDEASDRLSGVKTFVVRRGLVFSKRFLRWVVVPVELLTLFLTCVLKAGIMPSVPALLIVYLLWFALQKKMLKRENYSRLSAESGSFFSCFYDLLWPLLLSILLMERNSFYAIVFIFTCLWLLQNLRKELNVFLIVFQQLWQEGWRRIKPGDGFPGLESRARHALQRGLASLVSLQSPDGSFPMQYRRKEGPWTECHPLFSTVSVLLAAGFLLPDGIRLKAVEYVVRCRRPDGLWEFDPSLGIPADSDSSSCSLAVLAVYGSGLITDGDALRLRSFWRPDGGPFRTWNDEGAKWSPRDRDDAVVNSNILLALKVMGAPASDREKQSVLRLISASAGGTRYYCSPCTVAYAGARAGFTGIDLPERLLECPGFRKDFLPLAQWLSVVKSWDDSVVTHLLAAQSEAGCWPVEAWFTEVSKNPAVWGSRAISTAFCIEALDAALKSLNAKKCQ